MRPMLPSWALRSPAVELNLAWEVLVYGKHSTLDIHQPLMLEPEDSRSAFRT